MTADRFIACAVLTSLLVGVALACAPGGADTTDTAQERQLETRDDIADGRVTGTLAYRERMLLKPGDVIDVKLLDTSRADALATEIAHQRIENPGQQTVAFALDYDPADVRESMRYSVRATVSRGDRLMFTTDTNYPVLTHGADNTVDLILVRGAAASGPPPRPDASLGNTYWKLVWIDGNEYRYRGQQREPHLMLRTDGATASGTTGCNSFTGTYETDGDALAVSTMAVTEMACIDGMEIEAAFLADLEAVDRFDIDGDSMMLYAGEAAVLGFEAVYL